MTRVSGLSSRLGMAGIAAILACSAGMAIVPGPAVAAISRHAIHPSSTDSDGDGLLDHFELAKSHTNPHLVDTDGDGIPDGREDPDHDGLTNIWEQRLGLKPLSRDSDHDGVLDGAEDRDGDGLTNRLEIKGKVSDPRYADTDGDGLPDSAEDPDGDLLSNLGEQRWHTNPGKADTDGDGVLDGAEDANHNGISNAAEQDALRVPMNLTPALNEAYLDLPEVYADLCNVPLNDPDNFPACSYGNADAAITVALVGDSHASQWFPAVYAAAQARGWRVVVYTRSGCPWVDVTIHSIARNAVSTVCAEFRAETLAAIQATMPTIIIFASRVAYALYDQDDVPIPLADYESTWDAGMARTLDSLPHGPIPLVMEDTPYPAPVDVPACLELHASSIASCERSRAAWLYASHADAERTTAEAHGAHFGSLNDEVCPYDPCGVIFDGIVVYRDQSHITATFAATLAPSMGVLLDGLLAP